MVAFSLFYLTFDMSLLEESTFKKFKSHARFRIMKPSWVDEGSPKVSVFYCEKSIANWGALSRVSMNRSPMVLDRNVNFVLKA